MNILDKILQNKIIKEAEKKQKKRIMKIINEMEQELNGKAMDIGALEAIQNMIKKIKKLKK